MDIGIKIKELRISKGMTQEKLAEETDLSTRTIQRIENGDVDPRANSLQVIARALEVEYDYFKEAEEIDESEERSDQDNLWLAAMHLSMTVHLFFPTVILWKMKKDSIKGITKHFRDLITVQLFFYLIIIIPGAILYFSGIGRAAPLSENGNPWILILGFAMSLISAISNAVKVANNEPYNYSPFKRDEKTEIKGK